MLITNVEFETFVKALFKRYEAGEVPSEKANEFLAWATEMFKSWDRGNVELPVLFQDLYRTFQKSKDYAPSIEEIILQAEQRLKRPEYNYHTNAI